MCTEHTPIVEVLEDFCLKKLCAITEFDQFDVDIRILAKMLERISNSFAIDVREMISM
jgi:hypothetical protein